MKRLPELRLTYSTLERSRSRSGWGISRRGTRSHRRKGESIAQKRGTQKEGVSSSGISTLRAKSANGLFCNGDPVNGLDPDGRESFMMGSPFDSRYNMTNPAYAAGFRQGMAAPFIAGARVMADPRVQAGVKAAGGVAEIMVGVSVGAATSWSGVGIAGGGIIALDGLDQVVSAFSRTDSLKSKGIQSLGFSPTSANMLDAGLSGAVTFGAGYFNYASKLAAYSRLPEATGLSSAQVLSRWEAGSQALNDVDFLSLGGKSTNPLQKMNLIEKGETFAGEVYNQTTTPLQQFGKSLWLSPTGLTPLGDLGAAQFGGITSLLGGAIELSIGKGCKW